MFISAVTGQLMNWHPAPSQDISSAVCWMSQQLEQLEGLVPSLIVHVMA